MILLRDATPDDARGVRALLAALGYPHTEREVAGELAKVTPPGRGALLALDEQEPAGFAAYDTWRAFAELAAVCRLSALVVAPATRTRGVGRLLVAEVERRAHALGCASIELVSGRRAERAAAHLFYPALGFSDDCAHHAMYRKQLRAAQPRTG